MRASPKLPQISLSSCLCPSRARAATDPPLEIKLIKGYLVSERQLIRSLHSLFRFMNYSRLVLSFLIAKVSQHILIDINKSHGYPAVLHMTLCLRKGELVLIYQVIDYGC